MEDDPNFSGNERQPQLQEMEDDIIFKEMEDDLNFLGNGRQPQFFRKWKATSIFQ